MKVGDHVRLSAKGIEELGIKSVEQLHAQQRGFKIVGKDHPNPNDHSWCTYDVDGPYSKFILMDDYVEPI